MGCHTPGAAMFAYPTKPLALDSYLGWLDMVVARHEALRRPMARFDDDLDRVIERLRRLQQRQDPFEQTPTSTTGVVSLA